MRKVVTHEGLDFEFDTEESSAKGKEVVVRISGKTVEGDALAGKCVIEPHVIEDAMTGLTIEIKWLPSGGCGIFMKGKPLAHGNRDFSFDEDGHWSGQGTALI